MAGMIWRGRVRPRIGFSEAPRGAAQPAASSAAETRRAAGTGGSAFETTPALASDVASTLAPGEVVTTSTDSESHALSDVAFPAALHAAAAAAAWNVASAEAMAAATWDGGSGASHAGSLDGDGNRYYSDDEDDDEDDDDDDGVSSTMDGDSDSPDSIPSEGSTHGRDDDDDDALLSDNEGAGNTKLKFACIPTCCRKAPATARTCERVRHRGGAAGETDRHGFTARAAGAGGVGVGGGAARAAPGGEIEPLVAPEKRRKREWATGVLRQMLSCVARSEYTADVESDGGATDKQLRRRGAAVRGGVKQRQFRLSPTWRPLFVVVWAIVTIGVAAGVFVATYNAFEHERQEEVEVECEAWRVLLQEHFTDTTNQIRLLANLLSTFHFRKPRGTLDRRTFVSFLNETTYAWPHIHHISFAIRVPHDARARFERSHGRGFCIRDGTGCAAEEPEYAPILYTTSTQLPVGQDLMWAADATGLSAVIRARDFGTIGALTAPLHRSASAASDADAASIAEDTETSETGRHWVDSWGSAAESTAVLRVYPVYREGRAPPGDGSNVTAMRGACRGYMSALVDFTSLVTSMHKGHARMFVRIYDVTRTSSNPDRHIYQRTTSSSGGRIATAEPPGGPDSSSSSSSSGSGAGGAEGEQREELMYEPEDHKLAPGEADSYNVVTALDLGDPSRQHEMRCRYIEFYVFPFASLGWALVIATVMCLLGYVWWAASGHMQRLHRDFLRMQLLKNKMKAARNVAERASVAKGTFLATMSHELRTPMNGVIGMLNLLLETPLTITQLDYVETAHTSGRALLELINDILDLSKIEANKMPLECVAMDIRAQVDTVLTMFVERFRAKPALEVAAYVDPFVPAAVIGDSLRFRQVLVNLLSNAFKFTERGHIFIAVRTAHPSEDLRTDFRTTAHARHHRRHSHSNTHGHQHAATTRPSTADAATATSAGHPGVVKPNARHGNADSSSSPWEGEHVELLPSSVGRSTPNNAPGTTTSTTTSTAAGGRSAGEGARSRRSSSSSQGSSSSSSRGGSRGCSRERAGYGGRREGEWATLSGLEAVHSCNSWEDCVIEIGHDATHASTESAAASGGGGAAVSPRTVRLVITVEDTGEGIPKAAQKNILKPFTQADASTTRVHGGTGIGLSISRHLVALMGGKLAFSSRPGVGTTFFFDVLMPVAAGDSEDSKDLEDSKEEQGSPVHPMSAMGVAEHEHGARTGTVTGIGTSTSTSPTHVLSTHETPAVAEQGLALVPCGGSKGHRSAASMPLGMRVPLPQSQTFSPPRLALFPVDHHSGAASPRLSSPWPVRLSTSLNTSPHPFLPSSASPFQAALGAAARHQRNPSLQLLQSPLKGLQRLQGQQAERLRMLQSTPVHKLTASPIQMVEAASPLPLLQHAEATLTQFDALLLDDKPVRFGVMVNLLGRLGISVRNEPLPRKLRTLFSCAREGSVGLQSQRSTGSSSSSSVGCSNRGGNLTDGPAAENTVKLACDGAPASAGSSHAHASEAQQVVRPVIVIVEGEWLDRLTQGRQAGEEEKGTRANRDRAGEDPQTTQLQQGQQERREGESGSRGASWEDVAMRLLLDSPHSSAAPQHTNTQQQQQQQESQHAVSQQPQQSPWFASVLLKCGAQEGADGGPDGDSSAVGEGAGRFHGTVCKPVRFSALSACLSQLLLGAAVNDESDEEEEEEEGENGEEEGAKGRVVGQQDDASKGGNGDGKGDADGAGAGDGGSMGRQSESVACGMQVKGRGVKGREAGILRQRSEGGASGSSCSRQGTGGGGAVGTGGGAQVKRGKQSKAAQVLCQKLGGRRILVVDDNMVNRKVMSKMLQRYGVEVEAVDGGAKAVAAVTKADAAAAAPYDCVFMDLQMPGMDGLEATGLIRKHEAEQQAQAQAASAQHDGTAAGGKRRLLVIALTADVGAGTKEKCVDAGMDGYMTKPIEEDQLSRILLPFLN
ncbi:hypothetical protein CLOM_g13773 [Closterium sp. NIES-68]|nr:hypothetical protein CLOM_g13773 [Closterium sp. NIES-68]